MSADAETLLARALVRSAADRGVALAVVRSEATPWASATFAGARHELTLRLAGAAPERWLAALPEADLPLRGQLVADLKLVRTVRDPAGLIAVIEALTVEDR